ncbi:guanine deaminase [Mycolicibacterium confluentis]|uniref:Guanine deaminase n=1 Tax=Mycolicibacterium confluentis TaxID=28047 RepID=A0A7I7XZ70_9MYCO|nr:guanine deaminase [Mycolicibacterium confluentis]MCV7319575.1 guanine deaminase [Mycolicibacterium confluentis]ORV34193.1 guanine deaminase [Mycolicibacterium confluentis]BBZ34596.1 guanine deaminase [Mycolicibacterium confluentis]
MRAYRGHLFHIGGAPRLAQASEHLVSVPDGALIVDADGVIVFSGAHAAVPDELSHVDVVDCRPGFLLPGFVDTHIHYPQTFCTDSYGGGQLLDWLQRCIFPAEAKLADPQYARRVAQAFCAGRISAGTTAALVFGSAFPDAQDALYEESMRAGLRTVSGRAIQTVGPESATPLLTDEHAAITLTEAEITRWHGADTGDPATSLLHVAVVPRFALSVTRQTLGALGELYSSARDAGVYFHTHLSENVHEVAAVHEVHGVQHYLDTYEGLLGPRSVLAHAVHCTDHELARMAETGTSIAHCPTSQQFLGSGTMPWRRTTASGVNVALGSDVGAGDEWLLARVLNDCYKVHISEPAGLSIPPADLLFTGTLAGARALDLEDRIGNLDVGKEADFLVIDPQRQLLLPELLEQIDVEDADRLLFALLLGMREAAIAEVYVRGRRVSPG